MVFEALALVQEIPWAGEFVFAVMTRRQEALCLE
jgi:hypothetical protein